MNEGNNSVEATAVDLFGMQGPHSPINAVSRLVRSWLRFKYNLILEDIDMLVGDPWDDTSPSSILYRPMDVRIEGGGGQH
jgi:hypothetical protein